MDIPHHPLRRAAVTFAVALAAFVASGFAAPSTAEAARAYVSTDLNLRYGPSTHYQIIDVIPYGDYVEVLHCTPGRSWCEVDYYGYTGWVSAHYIYQSNHRRHHYGHSSISVPIFDFFFYISDYDQDRRYRHHSYRYDDHWYDRHRHHYRGHRHYRHDGRHHSRRGHGSHHGWHGHRNRDRIGHHRDDRRGRYHESRRDRREDRRAERREERREDRRAERRRDRRDRDDRHGRRGY